MYSDTKNTFHGVHAVVSREDRILTRERDRRKQTRVNCLAAVFSEILQDCFREDYAYARRLRNRARIRDAYEHYTRTACWTGDWKRLQKLHRSVRKRQRADRWAVGWAGFGMGLLGLGTREVRYFLTTLIRSVFETAFAYGMTCRSRKELYMLLTMITASLSSGKEYLDLDALTDGLLTGEEPANLKEYAQCIGALKAVERVYREQLDQTTRKLLDRLLWLKCLQCVPVLGCFGGIVNVICHRRILDYVTLKCREYCMIRMITDDGEPFPDTEDPVILSVEINLHGKEEE